MVSVPAGSALVVKVATPVALSVPVPRVVVPLRNVTVPVGYTPVTAARVFVNVTLAPKAGLALEDARASP